MLERLESNESTDFTFATGLSGFFRPGSDIQIKLNQIILFSQKETGSGEVHWLKAVYGQLDEASEPYTQGESRTDAK